MDLESLQYPIGRFTRKLEYDAVYVNEKIDQIRQLPFSLENLVSGWPVELFEKTYRPDGWNGRQIIHHLLDSHINALVRLKLALTEENPVIRPYEQDDWVKLSDYQLDPLSVLPVIKVIHSKMVNLFESLDQSLFERKLRHPEHPNKELDILWLLGMYSWHGEHHLGHLEIISDK